MAASAGDLDSEEWRGAVEGVRVAVAGAGLEVHPFKVGWYNQRVGPPFQLGYHDDTLAVVFVSTPSMFERLLRPFLSSPSFVPTARDPVDQCHKQLFASVAKQIGRVVTVIQDFELDGMRRPRILVQTAGHVAGAVRYYQRGDVESEPWPAEERVFGVAVHPRYGGWFALRGVLIFDELRAGAGLQWAEPPDPVTSREKRVELLEKFNKHWQDWSYRDVLSEGSEVAERYSTEQQSYFGTEPQKRGAVIARLRGERV